MSLKKINNFIRYIFLLLLLIPNSLYAQGSASTKTLENLELVGRGARFKENTDLKVTIAAIIQVLLGFIGIVFFILILWGGAQWMLSGGNEKKIEDAKKRIVNATIGLVLVVTSYAIARSINMWLSGAV